MLRRLLKEILLGRDLWLDRATDQQSVALLIASLRPAGDGGMLRRFGPPGDGGYLMPDDLEGVTSAVSPGVSFQCGFDLEIARRGIDVYMSDASVAAPPVAHPKIHF